MGPHGSIFYRSARKTLDFETLKPHVRVRRGSALRALKVNFTPEGYKYSKLPKYTACSAPTSRHDACSVQRLATTGREHVLNSCWMIFRYFGAEMSLITLCHGTTKLKGSARIASDGPGLTALWLGLAETTLARARGPAMESQAFRPEVESPFAHLSIQILFCNFSCAVPACSFLRATTTKSRPETQNNLSKLGNMRTVKGTRKREEWEGLSPFSCYEPVHVTGF